MPIRRPLLFMRRRNLLGSFIGKHYGFNRLSKSKGGFIQLNSELPVGALIDSSTLVGLVDSSTLDNLVES